ncbi:hypothetical protein TNCV_3224771 [Trichonephila clavipes]|nr:hypothetical protein TNCV_3224771 [Trichonephila clavipes]
MMHFLHPYLEFLDIILRCQGSILWLDEHNIYINSQWFRNIHSCRQAGKEVASYSSLSDDTRRERLFRMVRINLSTKPSDREFKTVVRVLSMPNIIHRLMQTAELSFTLDCNAVVEEIQC